jgi:hypothetical protein
LAWLEAHSLRKSLSPGNFSKKNQQNYLASQVSVAIIVFGANNGLVKKLKG